MGVNLQQETTVTRVQITPERANSPKLVLNAENVALTPEQLFRLCSDNPELRIELTAQREIEIMSPTNSQTGLQNAELNRQLGNWAKSDGSGVVFDSNTGFTLPDGAMRSPDASWIRKVRWNALTPDQRRTFAPICPDFVIELLSPSDAMDDSKTKMEEYIANGAQLGWLVVPDLRLVFVYRPSQPAEQLDNLESISADPTLSGFTLDLSEVW
jgi:Uma2 family endonuclease